MSEYIYQVIIIAVILLYPIWRIFKRTGLNPLFSFSVFIPFIGIFVSGLILTFATWKLNAVEEGES